jgi:hypothetical protein
MDVLPEFFTLTGEEMIMPAENRTENTWWARQDLNPEPDGYEPSALTIELQAPTWGQWLHEFVSICYSLVKTQLEQSVKNSK